MDFFFLYRNGMDDSSTSTALFYQDRTWMDGRKAGCRG